MVTTGHIVHTGKKYCAIININYEVRKSVIGTNIHIEVNTFGLTLDFIMKFFTTFRLLI